VAIYVPTISPELRQGEIITGLVQYNFNSGTGEAESFEHEYAILASQDCDLLRDYERKQNDLESDVNSVLVFELALLDLMRNRLGQGGDLLKQAKRNQADRYHVLVEVPAASDVCGEGLPSLFADFRRFFAVPSEEIYRQVAAGGARRRSQLEVPYKEHFQSRLVYYLSRVALPDAPGPLQQAAIALPAGGAAEPAQLAEQPQPQPIIVEAPAEPALGGDVPEQPAQVAEPVGLQVPADGALAAPAAERAEQPAVANQEQAAPIQ
jgi:hypothetical protein